jgi:glycosyltransferase involved in cell wall biosynthesis
VTVAAGPTVTALVPTYNGEAFVVETLSSLAAQDYGHLRVLVSDDCSTDATLGLSREVGADDARFEVTVQPRRLGWSANSNSLIAGAETDLVFFAFHDDRFEPSYVSRCVDALRADPGAVLAFADTLCHGRDGTDRLFDHDVGASGDRVERARPYVVQSGDGRYMPIRGVVGTERLRRAGGLRHSALVGERQADGRLLFQVALLGRFTRVPEVLCHKWIVATSLAASWDYGAVTQAARVLSYVPEIRAAELSPSERRALLGAVPVGLARVAYDRARGVGRAARRLIGEPEATRG